MSSAQDIEEEAFKPTRILDPETGIRLLLDITDPRYRNAIASFYETECAHQNTEKLRVLVANGTVQLRECCTSCGERIGTALSQKPRAWADSLPMQSPDVAETYKNRRHKQKHSLMLKIARLQYEEDGAYTRAYREYAKSDKWHAKRKLVLQRCQGICEGCGTAKAQEIHHVTYTELGSEFLFDLLGLCRPCHLRLHAKRSWLPDDSTADSEE